VRDKVVIATKFEWEIDPDTLKTVGLNSRPDYRKRSVADPIREGKVRHFGLSEAGAPRSVARTRSSR
jgi:aryl-alcohol dehydrogenase-like predicted oxidoreductase